MDKCTCSTISGHVVQLLIQFQHSSLFEMQIPREGTFHSRSLVISNFSMSWGYSPRVPCICKPNFGVTSWGGFQDFYTHMMTSSIPIYPHLCPSLPCIYAHTGIPIYPSTIYQGVSIYSKVVAIGVILETSVMFRKDALDAYKVFREVVIF